jgi:hypothetical protein
VGAAKSINGAVSKKKKQEPELRNSKYQISNNIQSSDSNYKKIWVLNIGVYLDIGAWDLEF